MVRFLMRSMSPSWMRLSASWFSPRLAGDGADLYAGPELEDD
jgi:hypothetical protein